MCQGIIVLRFWNHQVRQGLDSVFESNLVCAGEAVPAKTLTLILSLWQRERRALNYQELRETKSSDSFAPKSMSAESAIQVRTNSVQCPIETHFQRLLPANLNSWGDAPS